MILSSLMWLAHYDQEPAVFFSLQEDKIHETVRKQAKGCTIECQLLQVPYEF